MRFALPSLLAATLLASGSVLAQTGNAPAPAKPAAPATDAAKAKPEVKPLSIGDAAPALDIEHFVKGEPFKGFEAGKITVVEFWATWCGPCKAAFPHISELQERYKDYGVTVVGISDEKLEKVKPFIETPEWNEKMRYTVATDPDRSVYSSYMTAAGQNGIPTAFVVGKKGTVEWIGHPMNLDGVLEDVVKDRWDATAAKKKFEEDRAAEQEMRRNSMKLREAQAAGNWDEVIKLLDGMIEKSPENDRLLMQKMQICLASGNRPAEGYAIARRLFERGAKNATMLNQIAWTIVDPAAPVKERDTKFATEVAEKAVEITGGKDGAVLDTLARCYWLAGDKAKAIETQKKAVEAGGPMKADLEKTLAEYESAK
jgi:thiol-disulfide isomerase/thioredoxin